MAKFAEVFLSKTGEQMHIDISGNDAASVNRDALAAMTAICIQYGYCGFTLHTAPIAEDKSE